MIDGENRLCYICYMYGFSEIPPNSNSENSSNGKATPVPKPTLFRLGVVCSTPAVQTLVGLSDMLGALKRHLCGDWGDVEPDDAKANDEAVREGTRILSVYQSTSGHTFWIITEADRSATTIILPEDY